MRVSSTSKIRSLKVRLLTVLTAGTALVSLCSAVDVKHNVVAGTMSFIESYTDALWTEIIPPPSEILGREDEE